MSNVSPELLVTAYKIFSLLTGLALCYMGYRLFLAGVWGASGDLDAKYSNTRLILKGAAPGIFFALFGTIVITATIFKGLEISSQFPAEAATTPTFNNPASAAPAYGPPVRGTPGQRGSLSSGGIR